MGAHEKADPETEKLLSASKLRVRMKSPFYATLMLYAHYIPDSSIPTCATDGKDIFYNPEFMQSLPKRQLDGALLHEVLHAALNHAKRRATRDPMLWNIAGDVIVNGIIAKQDYCDLIPGHIRRKDLEHLRAEEVYEILENEQSKQPKKKKNGGQGSGQGKQGQEPSDPGASSDLPSQEKQVMKSPCFHEGEGHKHESDGAKAARQKANEAAWKQAVAAAATIQRQSQPGKNPAGWERIIEQIEAPQIDWRTLLWKFIVRTPTDWGDFDRRFVHQGLYMEELTGESVNIYICVDTSGSIDQKQLSMLLGEIYGILRAYPHLNGQLFFADAGLYGPTKLEPNTPLPKAKGGGGTSFVPFFDYLKEHVGMNDNAVAVYLTDGFGDFPDRSVIDTLWVVLPGGEDDKAFPFGTVARLTSEVTVGGKKKAAYRGASPATMPRLNLRRDPMPAWTPSSVTARLGAKSKRGTSLIPAPYTVSYKGGYSATADLHRPPPPLPPLRKDGSEHSTSKIGGAIEESAVRTLAKTDPVAAISSPNCPIDLWWKLAIRYPAEARFSPLFDLIFLEESGRWAQLEERHAENWYNALRQSNPPRLSDAALRLLGIDCAASVLSNFESEYPTDMRPRVAIKAATDLALGRSSAGKAMAASAEALSASNIAYEKAMAAKQPSGPWSRGEESARAVMKPESSLYCRNMAAWGAAKSASCALAASATEAASSVDTAAQSAGYAAGESSIAHMEFWIWAWRRATDYLRAAPRLPKPWSTSQSVEGITRRREAREVGARGRRTVSYVLKDVVEMASNHPSTYRIPSATERGKLRPDRDAAKITFCSPPSTKPYFMESMWVEVISRHGITYTGKLMNEPVSVPGLHHGDTVTFTSRNVAAIDKDVRRQHRALPPPPRRGYTPPLASPRIPTGRGSQRKVAGAIGAEKYRTPGLPKGQPHESPYAFQMGVDHLVEGAVDGYIEAVWNAQMYHRTAGQLSVDQMERLRDVYYYLQMLTTKRTDVSHAPAAVKASAHWKSLQSRFKSSSRSSQVSGRKPPKRAPKALPAPWPPPKKFF